MKAVVYNKFNIDSVLAAALVKSLGDKETKFFDNTVVVPETFDMYLWLDTELRKIPIGVKDPFKGKVHTTLKSTETDDDGFRSILYQSLMNIINADEEVSSSVIEVVMKLNGVIKRFNSNELKLEEIIFAFNNMKTAERILHDGLYVGTPLEIYKDIPLEKGNVAAFYSYMKSVKQKISNNHSHQYIKFKLRLLETFVTSVQDDWVWIKRLLNLSDQKYVNVNICPSGCVVDTNLHDFEKFKLDLNVKLSHVY
jgi:hypothetical protein